MSNSELYVGLMSGTSLDSVDAVLVEWQSGRFNMIGHHSHSIPAKLKEAILKLCQPGDDTLQLYAETDVQLGELFADATLQLLAMHHIQPSAVTAIGSHGQTVRHLPPNDNRIGFSQQIGDPNIIAARTRCATVADFRRADIALGGQGAPLVPAFHEDFFGHSERHRVIINIGGIANITSLAPSNLCIGFDTGPGNLLLDAWCWLNRHQPFDRNGEWGASGAVNERLLAGLKAHPFFALPSPKSTGRESFHLDWLNQQLWGQFGSDDPPAAQDVQATLCALTADSIAESILALDVTADEAFVCGGGAHNSALMSRLEQQLQGVPLSTTAALGLDSEWVEAVAFAWLAMRRIHHLPGNMPSVTGAQRYAVLGGLYSA